MLDAADAKAVRVERLRAVQHRGSLTSELAGEDRAQVHSGAQTGAQHEGAGELALQKQQVGRRRARIALAEELRPALRVAAREQVGHAEVIGAAMAQRLAATVEDMTPAIPMT